MTLAIRHAFLTFLYDMICLPSFYTHKVLITFSYLYYTN